MNTRILNTAKHSLTAVALLVAASSAMAAATWDSAAKKWNVVETVSTGTAVNASALSNGQGNAANPTTVSETANFGAASVNDSGQWGFGILSGNEADIQGPHGIDNGHGIDALLLNFGSAVNLSHLKLGWAADGMNISTDNNGNTNDGGASVTYNDSDLSVFAWTGKALAAGEKMSEKFGAINPTNLTASGWTLVGNFADAAKSTATNKNNVVDISSATPIYSSYWLVSAYSSTYGKGDGLDQGNDAFKVLTVAGNVCTTGSQCGTTPPVNKVPEPGSLALLGAALMGFVATRRRANKS